MPQQDITIKQAIIYYLEHISRGEWVFGGRVARDVADRLQKKESNVERRLRELEEEGKIERRLVENPGGKNRVVQYRIKETEEALMARFRKPIALQRIMQRMQPAMF